MRDIKRVRTPRANEENSSSTPHLDLSQSRYTHHRILADMVSDTARPDCTVVEIGCGVGHTLAMVSELRPDVSIVGIDNDPRCLERTGKRVPAAELVLSSLGDNPTDLIPDGCGALILSHFLEHVPSPFTYVQSCIDALPPGARVMIAVPNSITPTGVMSAVLRRDVANRHHYYNWDRSHWGRFVAHLKRCELVATAVDFVPMLPGRWRESHGSAAVVVRLESQVARAVPWLSYSHISALRVDRSSS
jgi:SAM-dependent methyltransferase